MHNHLPANPADCEDEYHQALNAYQDTGLRVFFCPGVRNIRPLVYGDNQAFLQSLPTDLHRFWAPVLSAPVPSADNYVRSVQELHAARHCDVTRVGFGPLAPQWCSLDLLQHIVAVAKRMRTLVHMHVAETILQKVFGLSELGCSMVAYLADQGLLSSDLIIAHGVWITAKDIDLLAASGTGLTHQPSSNLRLRAGIAPVGPMMDAGISVGLGLDGMGVNDDDDFLQEMKLCYRLQGLCRLDLDSPALSSRDVFKMATETNARLIGYGKELGRLECGRKADMVLFDYERMSHPFTPLDADPIDTLLYRGSGRHIVSVIVGGEELVVNGRIGTVDEAEIAERLVVAASRRKDAGQDEMVQMTEALKTHLARYYRGWAERVSASPYYLLNSRTDGFL